MLFCVIGFTDLDNPGAKNDSSKKEVSAENGQSIMFQFELNSPAKNKIENNINLP